MVGSSRQHLARLRWGKGERGGAEGGRGCYRSTKGSGFGREVWGRVSGMETKGSREVAEGRGRT